jgi:predicted transporter
MVLETWEQASSLLGLTLVVLGLIFLLAPILARSIPDIERIPAILLYVYRSDGFIFATSPILIILTLLFLLWRLTAR